MFSHRAMDRRQSSPSRACSSLPDDAGSFLSPAQAPSQLAAALTARKQAGEGGEHHEMLFFLDVGLGFLLQ